MSTATILRASGRSRRPTALPGREHDGSLPEGWAATTGTFVGDTRRPSFLERKGEAVKLATTWTFGLLTAAAVVFGGLGGDWSANAVGPTPCPVVPVQADDPDDDHERQMREQEQRERNQDLRERRDGGVPRLCLPYEGSSAVA
ncbi:hypothetical protein SAMN05444580_101122 [Rhodococcus tukisamuensis]|uniref:Uncharacterized protein n=1 Tax=Rhodococcus tukisamuensis TaxID=168276 RepID=A0A1G6MBH2_9NOCA|nr:hypothetical protein SAMN05444580_101122 [Rhodococcus tukisamuensis]